MHSVILICIHERKSFNLIFLCCNDVIRWYKSKYLVGMSTFKLHILEDKNKKKTDKKYSKTVNEIRNLKIR